MRFEWAELLAAGVHRLGLKPDDFWRLTPAELELMLGQKAGLRPMGRERLDALVAAFPDEIGEMTNEQL
ncbi:phage conserved hypothetical protein [Thalassococcus halodurans]|uniref:Phage tail assembly chaperone protein, TAC n=1 Tax=Thalassococcus halodurans TaxID=373675 RepID=A0A1H5ZV80_9RHOB|nr:phage conserved hypothetical protein [Thalassococcus halodurans]